MMHVFILIMEVLKGILEWGYAYNEFSYTSRNFQFVIYNAIYNFTNLWKQMPNFLAIIQK